MTKDFEYQIEKLLDDYGIEAYALKTTEGVVLTIYNGKTPNQTQTQIKFPRLTPEEILQELKNLYPQFFL